MKRKLNENTEFEYDNAIKICVSKIREDDPELDCNVLRDMYVDAGASVKGSHGYYNDKAATFMTITDLDEDDVMDILNEFLSISNSVKKAEEYIVPDGVETDYVIEPEKPEFPAYEDVELDNLDPEEDALNDDILNEGEDILEDAQEELRNLLSNLGENDNITFEPEIVLDEEYEGEDGEGNIAVVSIDYNGDMEVLNGEQVINAFKLTDADDIFTLCDVIKDELDSETAYPDYDDVDIDDEEYTPRVEKMKHHRHLEEKKKNDCCPGTGKVNEAESIDTVLADIDAQILNETKEAEAKSQQSLLNKAAKALKENRNSLYPNISYNGKSFDKMTLKELQNLYETVKSSIDALNERTLNESVVDDKVITTIDRKKQLLEYINNEITYRTTRQQCLSKLNEDNGEISDEELANLFGPAQGEDTTTNNSDENSEETSSEETNSEENQEDGEVVEISRVVITLKDVEAANDLKQACIEAEIPEDAFELENVEEESATEDEETSSEENTEDTNSEENTEENQEESSKENTNESYEYAAYVKALLEGEDETTEQTEETSDDTNSEENTEDTNSEENTEETSDDNEEEEDKQPKFILTNTDYINDLAKVLDNVYGITKEEFEKMVGGSIVDEESDENSKENNSEENTDSESSEEKKDDEEEIDPSDLFKNL